MKITVTAISTALLLSWVSRVHSLDDSKGLYGLQSSGLCAPFLDDRSIENGQVCANTDTRCEALADLDFYSRRGGGESCDTWCKRSGLSCTRAWDNVNSRSCEKRRRIECADAGNQRSICRCEPPNEPMNAGSGCCREVVIVFELTDLAAKWVEWSERGPTISSHFWVHVSGAMFDAHNAFEGGDDGCIHQPGQHSP